MTRSSSGSSSTGRRSRDLPLRGLRDESDGWCVMTFKLNDRVQLASTGERATIVHRYDSLFVDVSWDLPHATHWADGSPTTTHASVIHVGLLEPAGQSALFDMLADQTVRGDEKWDR